MLCLFEVERGNCLVLRASIMSDGHLTVPFADEITLYHKNGTISRHIVVNSNVYVENMNGIQYWHLIEEDDSYNPALLAKLARCSKIQSYEHSSIPLLKMLYDMLLFKFDNYTIPLEQQQIRVFFLQEHIRHNNRNEQWVESILSEGWERTQGWLSYS
jgi:hypothetical protein